MRKEGRGVILCAPDIRYKAMATHMPVQGTSWHRVSAIAHISRIALVAEPASFVSRGQPRSKCKRLATRD